MLGAIQRLFGKDRARTDMQLCVVLLSSDRRPGAEVVLGKLRELFPSSSSVLVGAEDLLAKFEVDGYFVASIHVDMPIPGDEVEHAARCSWMWEDASEKAPGHRSHVVVTGSGPGPATEIAKAVTCVAAAICAATDAIGVYWGEGGHLLEASMFVECAEQEDLPVPLWVGVRISRDDDGQHHTMTTQGLEALGHRDFEVLSTSMSAEDLAETALGVAVYVLAQGPVLEHGHTFGPTMEDKWRVEHAKSSFIKGKRVIRLHIP